MQLVQIEQTCAPHAYATEFQARSARPRVIPGADQEIVPRSTRCRRVSLVLPVILQRTRLIVIVDPRDREHRDLEPGVVVNIRTERVPVGVQVRMLEPFLKQRRRMAQCLIELAEGPPGSEPLRELRCPESLIRVHTILRGLATGERDP